MSKKLYQTSDGTKFYQEQDAKNHALSLKDRKVSELDKTVAQVAAKKTDKKTAAQLIEEIKLVDTLDGLNSYEGYKQVSVKASVDEKRAELIAAIEVNLETVVQEETTTEN